MTRCFAVPSLLGDVVNLPLPHVCSLHSPPNAGKLAAAPAPESMAKDRVQHPTIPALPRLHKPRTLAGNIRLGEPGLCCQSGDFKGGGREVSSTMKKTPKAVETTSLPSESEDTSQSSLLLCSAGEGSPKGTNTCQGRRAGYTRMATGTQKKWQ